MCANCVLENFFLCMHVTWQHSSSQQPCKMVLCWNGSTVLSGDIVGILASCALRDRGSEREGWVSRLVSSTCLIYCPAAFEVGQAEFTSLWFFVISPPRLQPRWGPSPSTTGYRKYLSLVAPGHCPWLSFPNVSRYVYDSVHQTLLHVPDDLYKHWWTLKITVCWLHNWW